MNERIPGALPIREKPGSVERPERDNFLAFCRGFEHPASDESQDELDALVDKWRYKTPAYVPDENIGVIVKSPEGPGAPNPPRNPKELYQITVVWHWPHGRIIHEYSFGREGRPVTESRKSVDWQYDNGVDSLPEKTIGSHSLPYVSEGEILYLISLLERSYEGCIDTNEGPSAPPRHLNPRRIPSGYRRAPSHFSG